MALRRIDSDVVAPGDSSDVNNRVRFQRASQQEWLAINARMVLFCAGLVIVTA
jgi:hypothetical protein